MSSQKKNRRKEGSRQAKIASAANTKTSQEVEEYSANTAPPLESLRTLCRAQIFVRGTVAAMALQVAVSETQYKKRNGLGRTSRLTVWADSWQSQDLGALYIHPAQGIAVTRLLENGTWKIISHRINEELKQVELLKFLSVYLAVKEVYTIWKGLTSSHSVKKLRSGLAIRSIVIYFQHSTPLMWLRCASCQDERVLFDFPYLKELILCIGWIKELTESGLSVEFWRTTYKDREPDFGLFKACEAAHNAAMTSSKGSEVSYYFEPFKADYVYEDDSLLDNIMSSYSDRYGNFTNEFRHFVGGVTPTEVCFSQSLCGSKAGQAEMSLIITPKHYIVRTPGLDDLIFNLHTGQAIHYTNVEHSGSLLVGDKNKPKTHSKAPSSSLDVESDSADGDGTFDSDATPDMPSISSGIECITKSLKLECNSNISNEHAANPLFTLPLFAWQAHPPQLEDSSPRNNARVTSKYTRTKN